MNAEASKSEYVVVARRYRPQTFSDLVGQGTVSQALCNALTSDRVGHAYLFTGARGVGKTSSARILAKSLNCVAGPTTEPCGECDICLQISNGDDVDVLEIDGASNRGIDEIRQLRSNVGIRPSRSRFKIYIIDEVHMLTKEAFNALLKTLEEPPEHVKFVFCTTEPGKIPVTVLSRCQRFDFAPVLPAEIVKRLQFIVQSEGAEAEIEALELLARRAAGSMRDSQSLLEQLLSFVTERITVAHVHSMLGTARDERLQAMLAALNQRDAASALAELDGSILEGVDAGQLAEQLIGSLRDMMAAHVGCGGDLLMQHRPSQLEELKAAAETWGLETLLAAVQILDQAIARMRQSVHGRILLELALVRIAHLEQLDGISGLIEQLQSLDGQVTMVAPAGARLEKKNSDGVSEPHTAEKAPVTEESKGGSTAADLGKSDADSEPSRTLNDASTETTSAVRDASVHDVVHDPVHDPVHDARTSEPIQSSGSEASNTSSPPAEASALATPDPVDNATTNQSSVATSDAPPASMPPASVEPTSMEPSGSTITRVDGPGPASSEQSHLGKVGRQETQAAAVGHSGEAARAETEATVSHTPRVETAPPGESAAAEPDSNATAAAATEENRGDSAGLAESESTGGGNQESAPTHAIPFEQGRAKEIWRTALAMMNDMTPDHGAVASSVAISGPNRLVVRFSHVYTSSKSFCERAERRKALEEALQRIVGQPVRLDFELTDEGRPQKTEKRPPVSKQKLRQMVTRNPFVEKAVDVFEGEVMGVDLSGRRPE